MKEDLNKKAVIKLWIAGVGAVVFFIGLFQLLPYSGATMVVGATIAVGFFLSALSTKL